MTVSSRSTLDQRRARHAWETVQSVKNTKGFEDFCGQAKKLPVRTVTAGLGQALAFIKAKGNAEQLLRAIDEWVIEQRKLTNASSSSPAKNNLIQGIIEGDAQFLRRATDEVLAYILWVNRFAEAEDKPGSKKEG